jgi:hypothetical protein
MVIHYQIITPFWTKYNSNCGNRIGKVSRREISTGDLDIEIWTGRF